jgi:hypothetical protein
MAANKTQQNDGDVDDFLCGVKPEGKQTDARVIKAMLEEVTGDPAMMWGDSIVGFGVRDLQYESGRELAWFDIGFASRKQNLVVYLTDGFDQHREILRGLGKHSTSVSCLYMRRLDDIDLGVLEELCRASIAHVRRDR